MEVVNPYGTPGAKLDCPEKSEQRIASRWRRLFGDLIDTALVAAAWLPMMMHMDWLGLLFSDQAPYSIELGSTAIEIAVFLLVNGYLMQSRGQTVGKRLVGTRVVGTKGEKPSWLRQVALRYGPMYAVTLLPWVGLPLLIADGLCIFRSDRRCLHDHLAATKVIEA